jgi:hypothetical protein
MTRPGPQSTVESQPQEQVSVFQTKPSTQVALSAHWQAQASALQSSPTAQPPQAGRHCTSQVARLQNSVSVNAAPAPQSAGHT